MEIQVLEARILKDYRKKMYVHIAVFLQMRWSRRTHWKTRSHTMKI